MIFTELRFLAFFAVVFVAYWLLRANRSRKVLLLGASYFFYGSWDFRFLSLLLASTGVDYALGRVLSDPRRAAHRRRWLAVSVIVNLGFLGSFKYCNFFIESAAAILSAMGLHASVPVLSVVLPAGISFYTFMSMSYTIDVYRGHAPAKSLLDFALFIAFFPHLVAGPILRASQFLPQLDEEKRWADVDARAALVVFLAGYVKKACVADNLAPIVDRYFARPEAFDAQAAWIAVLCYSVQIYGDFSGYSDMATGAARLLGYDLCKNFDAPYLAPRVTDFWRRWHISLSTWLRDYLYIPLGGNRKGPFRTYVSLMVTMLLGGLWHGAAWSFVVWGGMHGAALAFERALGIRAGEDPGRWAPRRILGVGLTFLWVATAWIFFRSAGLGKAMVTLRAFALLRSPGTERLPAFLFGVLAALAAIHMIARRGALAGAWRRLPAAGFALLYGVVFALAVACVPVEHRPFIYFQF